MIFRVENDSTFAEFPFTLTIIIDCSTSDEIVINNPVCERRAGFDNHEIIPFLYQAYDVDLTEAYYYEHYFFIDLAQFSNNQIDCGALIYTVSHEEQLSDPEWITYDYDSFEG